MKVLITGLPGTGKTSLAKELAYHFHIPHHNADTIRELHDDWDFSEEGRMRQAMRMSVEWGILDFVCPLNAYRYFVDPNYVIWMNTLEEGRYADTNKIFETPTRVDIEVKKWIEKDQLRKCLEDFNPGIEGIQSFLKECMPKLVKL